MASPPAFYHALLRPTVLQILRATGYYACKPAVLDTLTEIAARYLILLAEKTAAHAVSNDTAESPTIVDVRMALQDVAAVLPERSLGEQEFVGVEDTRGMDEFLSWFGGPRDKMIREYAAVDGDPDATDFLAALKKKHSKTGEDSKYHATILGRGNDQGEVLIEGAEEVTSIRTWERSIAGPATPPPESPPAPVKTEEGASTPSSTLSSIPDMDEKDMDMDMS
ncbi:related to TAF(II) complex (TBP-associated protein complex) component [Cephalotrichum gorgonifer]|uniref:Related to TAF(II) complex (TBP-associated protein complex) component n=1 Tax=Cephalotrichum gorgonifer TaxID=2041049 RepID=A0AAE8MUZ9_9PEZI|nr:related to TAF(II) complex (TBP-associated protein complex) component [Cephalotrichum gorgonifer]